MGDKNKVEDLLDIADIHVTGRNVLVTDAMKNYVLDKLSKIERFSSRVMSITVTMDIQRYDHHIDIIIKLDNTKIKATAHTDNMYASIDKAVDRLSEQIRRYKEKIRDHHAPSHAEIAMQVSVYSPSDDLVEMNDEIEAESNRRLNDRFRARKLVKQETKPLKTLTVDEAIVKMELSGDAFMIFLSEEDRKLKVIYLRDDGNFGIISPEK